MGFASFLIRKPRLAPDSGPHRGYYALDERIGASSGYDGPDYDDWDGRLADFDRRYGEVPRQKSRWWQAWHWKGRRKRWWAVRVAAGVIGLFILLVAWLAITAPLDKSLQPIAAPQVTLLAADGTPIARNGAIIDEPVDVSKLPPHVVEAFLAIEDRRFYDHWGVDPYGIARAAWSNLTGEGVQGGSTITQQLAKFTFLTPEQTLTRKAREMLIAFWLEAWLKKEEILERYLSNAYFGDNTYGLRAASLHYFYRQPENLTLSQATMLAGLLQAPSRYNPTRHYDRAEARRQLVVAAMVDAGYITSEEAERVRPPALDVRMRNELPTGTYFADWALPQARALAQPGYSLQTLTTTLDSRLQNIARNVTSRGGLGKAQVALVAMRPNGEVVAMVGGKDYENSPFNRATQARRQPGSTFKLFVYLAALRNGWSPDDIIDNREFTTGSYQPQNAGGKYSPTITLKDAFAYSSNVAAVRLMQEVGSEQVIATARDLGVTSPLPEGDPSMALGTSTMTLIELTSAYAALAADSYPVEPRAFALPEPSWWERLWNSLSSFSSPVIEGMEEMLRAAVNRGTGRAAMLSGPNFGKTGTTQDNRDALFVGYAGDLVVGVWIGNDDNSPLPGISGGEMPARIWRDFMTRAQSMRGQPDQPLPREQEDPGGPVEPLDVPDIGDIPLGEGNRIRIENGQTILTTEIDGVPVDVRLGEQGVGISIERIEEARRRAEERAILARERFESEMIEQQERFEEARRREDARLVEPEAF